MQRLLPSYILFEVSFNLLYMRFCDVKAHKYDLHSFPGRLEIPPDVGVRFTQHREVDWLHVWVVLRRCYYIEHTVVTTVVVNALHMMLDDFLG